MDLIVGCGFLGSYTLKALLEQKARDVLATVRRPEGEPNLPGADFFICDVADPARLQALKARLGDTPLTVYYFAAFHQVDRLFEDPAAGKKVNLRALSDFLTLGLNVKRFFFASTDCIYGENTEEYPAFPEEAPLCPVNEYGRQKAAAEAIVRSHGYTVLRFPFMLGPSLSAKPHFYDKAAAALQKGEPLEMIDGMVRSVLSYRQTAALLVQLSRLPAGSLPGILNVCGDEGLTKYEMGLGIAKRLGCDPALVKRITEEEGRKFFKDARAHSAVMDNTRLKRLLGLPAIRWEL